MCGICGIYDGNRLGEVENTLIAMRDVMTARGPDAAGLLVREKVAFGHRRLSIIDLSDDANQPMANAAGTVWITFNGEIYNFIEIRDELEKLGRRFRTQSDTETIIQGYEVWGLEKLLNKLNGMFAFALWDEEQESLFLVRDRLGVKPLLFCRQGDRVYFASDLKAILSALPQEPELNPAAVDRFLHYYCLPQSMSIFKGVRKTSPGCFVKIRDGEITEHRYWDVDFSKKNNALSQGDWLENCEAILRDAVRCRLRSDVPVGAFLSGGVDSSLVVALMAQENANPPQTFSIGFKEDAFNELPFAKAVAERYATRHEEIILEPNVRQDILKIIHAYGEPFGDSSAVPTFYVSQAARRFVKVALSGDGGDEAFGGYDPIKATFASQKLLSWLPDFALGALMRSQSGKSDGRFKKLRTLINYQELTRHNRGWDKYALFSLEQKKLLYNDAFLSRLSVMNGHLHDAEIFAQTTGLSATDKMLHHDYLALLPDDYLVKVDVASMLNSLEVRSPFLDYRLVELMASAPAEVKLRINKPKFLLKKLAEKFLPQENIYRPKAGFAMPVGSWFQKDWAQLMQSLLVEDSPEIHRFFDMSVVKSMLEQHVTGKRELQNQLWTLLTLELWLRLFISKRVSVGDILT